jgi:hypothetical protein
VTINNPTPTAAPKPKESLPVNREFIVKNLN